MDYKQASTIRKKSLLSLIAQNKFEQGQGLGSSIGTAISDKFKAKAVGYKEKFDPLNWISALTGKGTFGRVATTIAGRAFGRSDEAVEYFGGYARKNKKDPHKTNIGPGRILNLRTGDSIADIAAKLYNLMKMTFERDKINREIELSFRKEQIDEDERRHKKLIDEILKISRYKPSEKKEDLSWLEKLKNSLKKMLAPITLMIADLIKRIEKLLPNFVKDLLDPSKWVKVIAKILGSLGLPRLAGKLLDHLSEREKSKREKMKSESKKTTSIPEEKNLEEKKQKYKPFKQILEEKNQNKPKLSKRAQTRNEPLNIEEKKGLWDRLKDKAKVIGSRRVLNALKKFGIRQAVEAPLKAAGAASGPPGWFLDAAMVTYDVIQLYKDLADENEDTSQIKTIYDVINDVKNWKPVPGNVKTTVTGHHKSQLSPEKNIPPVKKGFTKNLGLGSGEEVIEINTINNVGGKSEFQDITPINPRNDDESINLCLRHSVAKC